MSRIIGQSLCTALCVLTLAGVGCGGDEAEPNTALATQLTADRAEAMAFWWEQGTGERSEHLVLARATSGSAQLALFEIVPGGSWQRLFEAPPTPLPVTTLELVLNDAVNREVRGTIAMRLADELGGRAAFERQIEPTLETDDGEPLEALVLGSALMVVPSALEADARDAWFDALVLAHAAALRREATQADPAAYGQTLMEVLTTVGWVTIESGSTSGSPSDDTSRPDLLGSMAVEAGAEPWLRALGLLH